MEAAVAIQKEDVGAEERRGHCCSANDDDEDDTEWKRAERWVRGCSAVRGGQQTGQDCQWGGGVGGQCHQQRFFHQGGGTPNPIVLGKEADG